MVNYLVFLVLLHTSTDKPTLSLLMAFPTAKECNEVLARAPKVDANKFACIKIDMKPLDEGQEI